MAAPNRRVFFRQTMSVPIALQAGGIRTSIPATLVDISGGGCNVQCRMQFRTGTPLRFELLTLDGRLTLAGVIRLARYTAVDRTFSYGIEFAFVEERVRDQLLNIVNAERFRSRQRIVAIADQREREERGPRVRADIAVTYTLENAPAIYSGFATDVSLGGMRLETDRSLRAGSHVRVFFALPDRPETTLGIEAHTLPGVRSRNALYIHRIRFDDVSIDAAQELERYILKGARL